MVARGVSVTTRISDRTSESGFAIFGFAAVFVAAFISVASYAAYAEAYLDYAQIEREAFIAAVGANNGAAHE